jgi:rare lipoprotein A (peptidoglycan hydrolase)
VDDVRHPWVVASAALIALLATVAVPVPVGSTSPSSFDQPDTDLFANVEIAAAVRGTSMTITPDPGAHSDGTLETDSTMLEPDQRPEPDQARPVTVQPAAAATKVVRNPWHRDREISWYGPGFYGKRTACGLALTTSLVGVAHRTLPCGTLVTFKDPGSGRTLTVPVVDRGPYVSGRTWDLTGAACRKLHHCYTGSISWRYVPD